MESYRDIIKKRTTPGVMIFDLDGRLLFANREAEEIIPDIIEGGTGGEQREEIRLLLERMKKQGDGLGEIRPADSAWPVIQLTDGTHCSLRASYLGGVGKEHGASHIMVLVERVVEKHGADLDLAVERYGLSNRERQVLQLLCQGLMNRDIGEHLFICEYTVKDHLKNIMKKMGVGSRGEIIAALQ